MGSGLGSGSGLGLGFGLELANPNPDPNPNPNPNQEPREILQLSLHALIEAFIVKANKAFKEQGYPLKFANWFSVWSMLP